jgi:hypothetical protein
VYHHALRTQRSCAVVGECLSAVPNSTLRMQAKRDLSRVSEDGNLKVTCNPLADILRRFNRTRVDFWSLDVRIAYRHADSHSNPLFSFRRTPCLRFW